MRVRSSLASLADAAEARLPRPLAVMLHRLRATDLFLLSAALAFYALVSVVPFAILVLWIVGAVSGTHEVHDLANRVARALPANLGADRLVQQVANLGAGLGFGALVALLWPATSYGSGLRRAFSHLSAHPHEDDEAKGLRGRALALAMLGVVPALVLSGLVASYLGATVLGGGGPARVLGLVMALAFGFVAATVAVALTYRLFAPGRLPWAGVLRGSAAAAAAISVVSLAYVVYLDTGVDFEHRYLASSLASAILLAFWLYLVNALILVGFQMAEQPWSPPGGAPRGDAA